MQLLSNGRLVKIGSFDFQLRHLLIIGILAIAFSVSFMIRSQGADYGYELNEFDPFFNFRATEFLINNGLSEYNDWHDDKSWHPNGRDVSATSQVMLHITAAVTYQLFGGGSDLYDFTIIFPVVFGSMTVFVVFALVRVIGGTTAGLFAAIFYSISVPIIVRGTIGWFKSEPLGLFYGLLGTYLFLSGIGSTNKKVAILKLIGGGIVLSFGLASWGGIQFFVIPMGIFILGLSFVRKDHNFLIWSIPVFVISFLVSAIMFERPGIDFIFGLGGFSLIGPTGFLIANILLQRKSKPGKEIRNGLALLAAVVIIGSTLLVVNAESEFIPLPTYRYLNAINPFLTTSNPLVDSVSEHATTTLAQSFFFHSVLMIFAGIGIWLIFSRNYQPLIKNDMILFSLIIGLIGVYVSSAFVRLEVFASVAIIILSSLGLSILCREIFRKKPEFTRSGKITKISLGAIIIVLLFSPLIIPANGNWVGSVKNPPTILNGGSAFTIATNDWKDTLEWIKQNTPEDSVVAAWWDYGYWITTMSDRTTLADNATIDSERIAEIARMLLSSPDDAWVMLRDMDANYILVFVAGQKLDLESDQSFYILNGGGDESKKPWFMRIAGEPLEKYLFSDGRSGTDEFWNNTLLGKMFPFSVLSYVNFQTNQESQTYQPFFQPIYVKDIKYPSDGNGPLRLVYASQSFTEEKAGPMIGVFVYEVNPDYKPNP